MCSKRKEQIWVENRETEEGPLLQCDLFFVCGRCSCGPSRSLSLDLQGIMLYAGFGEPLLLLDECLFCLRVVFLPLCVMGC